LIALTLFLRGKLILLFEWTFIAAALGGTDSACIGDITKSLRKDNILIIGESHLVKEENSIQYQIIESILNETSDSVFIYLEQPVSLGFLIEEFGESNDVNMIIEYLKHSNKTDSSELSMANAMAYSKLSDLFSLQSMFNRLSIKCVDRERRPRAAAYSLLKLLNKYLTDSSCDSNLFSQLTHIINGDYSNSVNELLLNQVQQSVIDNLDCFRKNISESHVLYYLDEIVNNLSSMESLSLEREQVLYRNIRRGSGRQGWHIAILGNRHVNKYYDPQLKLDGNYESVGSLLNESDDSPFKNQVVSVYTRYLYSLNGDEIHDNLWWALFQTREEAISSAKAFLKRGKNCQLLETSKFEFAWKAFDFILMFKYGDIRQ